MSWLAEVGPVNHYLRLVAWLEKWSLTRASVVTVESSFAMRYLKRKFPHLEVRQTEHAPDRIFHQVQRRPQINPVRFMFVGSLSYLKGADLLFKALDQLKGELSFQLIVIGKINESFLGSLKNTVSSELWQRIHFRGSLTSEEVAGELATATMMIYPTRVDNSPNAVKEAVVAGVPVVASAIGGITDYVILGENGYLFPSENLDACISAIKAACRHPLFSQGLVEEATLVKMRDYLSPERMGQSFFETYQLIK
jgi:glycosyltransferase involved in cell wall biosynthesis